VARLVIEVHVLDIVVLIRGDDQNEARRRKQTLMIPYGTVQNCVLIQIHFRFIFQNYLRRTARLTFINIPETGMMPVVKVYSSELSLL